MTIWDGELISPPKVDGIRPYAQWNLQLCHEDDRQYEAPLNGILIPCLHRPVWLLNGADSRIEPMPVLSAHHTI